LGGFQLRLRDPFQDPNVADRVISQKRLQMRDIVAVSLCRLLVTNIGFRL
jgi:hypothetical protein